MIRDIANIIDVYQGSNGDATRALYADLTAIGPIGVGREDAAGQRLLHAIEIAGIPEGPSDGVLRQLIAEPHRHEPIRVDARQVFQQDRLAVLAPVALPNDAQKYRLPLDRMVPELDHPFTVFPNFWVGAGADRRLWVRQRDVNDQRSVANLVADGHKPFQPQQIQTFQHLTTLNPGWRNCRRAPVESQTEVAA